MLYYIHGYLSSPDSTKGTLFKKTLNAHPIEYRTCKPEDLIIDDCLKQISNIIKEDKNIILIGSSLGGFLASKTALIQKKIKKIILLNPAIIPPSYDIKKDQNMPYRILKDMIEPNLFRKKIEADIFILIGTEDKVVPQSWIIEFAQAQEATIRFLHDDHMFSKNLEKLPNIISDII